MIKIIQKGKDLFLQEDNRDVNYKFKIEEVGNDLELGEVLEMGILLGGDLLPYYKEFEYYYIKEAKEHLEKYKSEIFELINNSRS